MKPPTKNQDVPPALDGAHCSGSLRDAIREGLGANWSRIQEDALFIPLNDFMQRFSRNTAREKTTVASILEKHGVGGDSLELDLLRYLLAR
jgi:hypothetical protein